MEIAHPGNAWIFWVILLAFVAGVIIIAHKEDVANFFSGLLRIFGSRRIKNEVLEQSVRAALREHYELIVRKADMDTGNTKYDKVERRFIAIQKARDWNPLNSEYFHLAHIGPYDNSTLQTIAEDEYKNALYEYCGIRKDIDKYFFRKIMKSRHSEN